VVSINRPERRNAVDTETADALYRAFFDFDGDDEVTSALRGN
jgi:enoyl-CoA hydratase